LPNPIKDDFFSHGKSNEKMTERPKASFRQQLTATIVRNLRLKLRDSRKTLLEIFLPLYTLGTLIVLKILIPNPNFPAILEPHGSGRVFEHFNALKNHTIAVVQNGNGSRQNTVQVRVSLSTMFQKLIIIFIFLVPGRSQQFVDDNAPGTGSLQDKLALFRESIGADFRLLEQSAINPIGISVSQR
jgi:hypothetical protein